MLRRIRKLLATTGSLGSFFWDRLVLFTPVHHVYKFRRPGVAFLVHPRDISDIYRKFPFFQYFPEKWTRWFGRRVGAITLSQMKIPNDVDGQPIRAELHTIGLDPRAMLEDKKGLEADLLRLAELARRKNLSLIALGALLPSMSRYGELYTKNKERDPTFPHVTTGHMMTSWCITETFRQIKNRRHGNYEVTIGVLGAAGSTGTLTCQFLRRMSEKDGEILSLHLVDRNKSRLERVRESLPGIKVTSSTKTSSLQKCDYIIVVTNAKEVVLRPEHVKLGSVVIDDTQPRATSPELLEKAYVVDVLASVPGLNANFNFGFKTKDTQVTFSCLAEMVLLAVVQHQGNFAVGPAATKSPKGTMEQFFVYLEKARGTGLDIKPVLDVSFAKKIPEKRFYEMLLRQTPVLRTAAE